jgi:DNA-binding beta-propeller fold protein YncE
VRVVVVCLLVAVWAVACGPGRGLRLERSTTASDRRAPVDALVEVDPNTGSVVHVVRLVDPGPVAVSGSSVWVVSPVRRTVFRIDAHSARVLATTRLAAAPVALAPGPAGSVWVLISGGTPAVVRLNADTGRIVKRIGLAPCCPGPSAIASAPSGVLWVAGQDGVVRIDPRSGIKTIVAPHLRAVAIATGSRGRAFVSDGWGTVTPLPADGLRGITITYKADAREAVPAEPTGLAYSHGALWVVDGATHSVLAFTQFALDSRVDVEFAAVAVGRAPADIAYGEGSVWVANRGDGTISQIDPARGRMIRTIHLGYRPAGLAVGAGFVWATTRRISPTAAAIGLLAFDDRGRIFTSRPDGSLRTQLTHPRAGFRDFAPVASPDGRLIAFVRVRTSPRSLSIVVMRRDGSRQRRLPNTGDADLAAPAWSPDGQRLVFAGGPGAHLYSIAPDGSHRALIPHTGVAELPSWSPDGTRIAFDGGRQASDEFLAIQTVRADGSDRRVLTPALRQQGRFAVDPEWSPDGHTILFDLWQPPDHLGEYVVPASGGTIRELIPAAREGGLSGIALVAWSPDGSQIAISGQQPASAVTYIANADGTGLTRISHASHTTWLPAR